MFIAIFISLTMTFVKKNISRMLKVKCSEFSKFEKWKYVFYIFKEFEIAIASINVGFEKVCAVFPNTKW